MGSKYWLALVLLGACGTATPHPPPEGEWLEWTPSDKPKKKNLFEEEDLSAKPDNAKKSGADAAAAGSNGKKPTAVSCSGKDNVRDSVCVAKSDLGGDCPATLAGKASSRSGTLEAAPDDARRDSSLESGSSLCCYAWCVKVPASGPDKCKKGEGRDPLFCFEAPASGTTRGAGAPYPECPAGLKKTPKKARKLEHPSAAFSKKQTDDARADAPKACCYEACSKSK